MTMMIDLSDLIASLSSTFRFDGEHRLGERIADILRADVQRQFSEGGSPIPWRPLSPRTIAQKQRAGYPRLTRKGTPPLSMIQRGGFGPQNILMRTGALLSSWTRWDDPSHVQEVTSDSVMIGTMIPYAGAHQEGVPDRNLPKRPIVLTSEAKQAVVEEIAAVASGGDD